VESRPVKAERILYRLSKQYWPRCWRTFQSRAPAVLPKSLYDNQLLATTTMHDCHGTSLGRVCEQTGLGLGSLVEIFHRMARLFASIPDRLVAEYRQAPMEHADETSWRTSEQHGDTWLFATPQLSLVLFRQVRAAGIAQALFGTMPLPGCLVVVRNGGDNKAPCVIQYGSSRLLREVQAPEQEFPQTAEGTAFVGTVARCWCWR
jgi:transposase